MRIGTLFQLSTMVPPGLPDIKWNELYSKWEKSVPENRKHGLKYYVKKSPLELKKKKAAQSAQAKAVRATRTRCGTVEPPKTRGRPKKQN
jgi:hypothetical protein